MSNVVLIVDPFSTGKMYAHAFRQLGYECYAVLSSPNVPDFFQKSADLSNFQQPYFLSPAQVKQQFSVGQVHAVVIGSETGVFVGEKLAAYFHVKGNNPATSDFRRDKFAMQQQLKRVGLNYIDSQIIRKSDRLPEVKDHAAYVLKPLNSAGTEGVVFCANKTELFAQIQQIEWGKTNITGEQNYAFLVQEFIEGEEFVVDMVADQQQIYTVSLCRYRKNCHNGSRFVYEYMEMLNPADPVFQALIDYAHQCAKALDFTVGAIHMEIMQTGKGAVMIEAGGRLHGGVAPKIFQQCYQPSLLAQAVNIYHKNAIPIATQQTQYAKVVFMINEKKEAILDSERFLTSIQSLPSFFDVVISVKNPLPLTVDLLTCPCFVSLVSKNKVQLEEDERALRTFFEQCLS